MLPEISRHLEKLGYFYEMVQAGSLQETARKLGVSPATLSYSLKELEAVAETQLFVRSKKGMAPTEAGEKLFQFCRKLYRDLDEVSLALKNEGQKTRHRVRVGTFSSIAIYFWPLIQKSLKNQKELTLSLTTKRSREILEALMKREVDVAITVGTLRAPEVTAHKLYTDSYGFYGKKGSKFSSPKESTLFYLPDATDDEGKNLRSHVHDFGLRFQEEFELDSFDVIKAFIMRGEGVGILPVKVAQNMGDGLERISLPGLKRASFGSHSFYLSHRLDLEILQRDLTLIKKAAEGAVRELF